MMIDPPIDKLIKKTECRYMLVCGVAKRARELLQQEGDMLAATKQKPISVAAKEIYEGKVKITKD
ncbi:MAG: DNA-directed RNA polymerase subunit omega [Clostridia bacterium]|nr:DNA-directed RNA polymerase subunit omega [Clostridia bacterium]